MQWSLFFNSFYLYLFPSSGLSLAHPLTKNLICYIAVYFSFAYPACDFFTFFLKKKHSMIFDRLEFSAASIAKKNKTWKNERIGEIEIFQNNSNKYYYRFKQSSKPMWWTVNQTVNSIVSVICWVCVCVVLCCVVIK